jgi:hypothetical protein
MIKIKPKHLTPILRSFLFLGSLSIATVLSIGLLNVPRAEAGFFDKVREAGRKIDPTNPNSDTRRILRENDPTSPAFAENQWGNAGGAAFPAAVAIMRGRNGNSRSLDDFQRQHLIPHFGNLVDQVAIIYNAKMLDQWSAGGKTINLSGVDTAAQAYCNRIYVRDSYKPNDLEQIKSLGHELVHTRQCQQLGGEGKFGFHYFREFKRANQNYANNKLEKEAYDFESKFAAMDHDCTNNNITITPTDKNLEFPRGTEWVTCSGYKFVFQNDSNLVLYNPSGNLIWATGTNAASPDKFVVQADGNVVLYRQYTPVWATTTNNPNGIVFAIQWDGNVVIYNKSWQPVWSTNTTGR